MKRVKRLLFVLLCICITISSIPITQALEQMVADNIAIYVDNKVYCSATIDDAFDDDSILVVLDKGISELNKAHEKSFFGNVAIKNVVDLSAALNENATTNASQSFTYATANEEFRQIIKLELPVKGKENVLKAIKALEQIDGIM